MKAHTVLREILKLERERRRVSAAIGVNRIRQVALQKACDELCEQLVEAHTRLRQAIEQDAS